MASQTSLARQLELLKLPQTSVHKETHGTASFLYDFFEAKNIDADTHYSTALDGLENLAKIDSYVETFKDTLFHESSKKFDRAVETKQSNEKIDLIINEFLYRIVSKYFQLSDTHKMIEWLIYRHRVNEYNMDALIGSVLPYHETRQFVRLLQTCSQVKNPRNSRWYWLKGVQENGVPLAKSVLLNHCTSNEEFFRVVTDSVFKSIQIDPNNSIFPPFLVSFCVNLLERSNRTVPMIMSVVSKALRMKNHSLYVAAYMIFSHLGSVDKLDPDVVNRLFKSFLKTRSIYEENQVSSEGVLLALNIVCYKQNMETLPMEFLDTEKNNIIDCIVNCSKTYHLGPLIKCMLCSIIVYSSNAEDLNQEKLHSYHRTSEKLLSLQNSISESAIISLVSAINKAIAVEEDRESQLLPQLELLYSQIVNLIEKRFPASFDSAIGHLPMADKIVSLLDSVRYSFVECTKLPLSLGLAHSSKRVRRKSLLHLVKNFNQFLEKQQTNDADAIYLKQIIRSNLLTNMQTTDPDIFLELFSIEDKIFDLFSAIEFEEIAVQIVNTCNSHDLYGTIQPNVGEEEEEEENVSRTKWNMLKQLLLKIYCSRSFEEYRRDGSSIDKALDVLNNLFSGSEHSMRFINYLLPANDQQLLQLVSILDSKYAKTNPLLLQIANKCEKVSSFSKLRSFDSEKLKSLTESFAQASMECITNFCVEHLDAFASNTIFDDLINSIQSKEDAFFQRRVSLFMLFTSVKVYRQLETQNDIQYKLGNRIIGLLSALLSCLRLKYHASTHVKNVSDFNQTNGIIPFLGGLDSSNCESISTFLVGYVLHSLTNDVQTLQLTEHSNWDLAKQEDISQFYLTLYRVMLSHTSSNDQDQKKSVKKLFRSLLTSFLDKIVVHNEKKNAFQFFVPILAYSNDEDLRFHTLSLLDSLLSNTESGSILVASITEYPQFMIAYLIALGSSSFTSRQLAQSNLKIIHRLLEVNGELAELVKTILNSEQEIVNDEKAICKILVNASSDGQSLPLKFAQEIIEKLSTSRGYSQTLRCSLLNLLHYFDVDIKVALFKFEFEKFFSSINAPRNEPFSADDELELKALLDLMQHPKAELFQSFAEKPNVICQFYLSLLDATRRNVTSENLAINVYDLFNKKMFKRMHSVNEEFALQIVTSLIHVQLALCEIGSSRSASVDNLLLINKIKRQLGQLSTDGMFIIRVLDRLMPIEEIYDSFAYISKKEATAEKRPRRTNVDAMSNESKYAIGWKLLRIYIGLFQSKSNIDNCLPLMKTLFDYLKLTFMEVDDDSNEYTRQSILYVIANCIESKLAKKSAVLTQTKTKILNEEFDDDDRMEVDTVDTDTNCLSDLTEFLNHINVDAIVDCMRESRLKETQKIALLLISLIAPHFQKQIIDYLVAIFTFIGTSLLQCDDQYSLAILFETMESIIPIILQHDESTRMLTSDESEATDMKQYMISIFVKSFSDIPTYRRLPLFVKLVELLGENHLALLSVRLLEEACLVKDKMSRTENGVFATLLQGVFTHFSAEVQYSSICTLLCLFERKFFDHNLKKKSLQKKIFVSPHIPKHRHHQKGKSDKSAKLALSSWEELSELTCKSFTTKIIYDSDKLRCGLEILRFVVSVISDSDLAEKALKLANESQSSLLIYFLNLVLELIVSLGPSDSTMKPSLNLYRKRIKSTLDEMLLKFNASLPAEELIRIVTNDLLDNTAKFEPSLSCLIQRKSLELLNEKLIRLSPTELGKRSALKIIKSLMVHLPSPPDMVNKCDDLRIHNIQLIMVSLKFSTKFLFAPKEETISSEAIECLSSALALICELANAIVINRSDAMGTEISSSGKLMQNLKSSCILCATQILCTMSLEGIQHLADVVALILDNFDTNDDIILISNVSSLSKLIGKFPQFLSPHLKAIILKLLYAYTFGEKVASLRSKLQAVWSNMAKSIPKRVMFEAINASYDEATALSPRSIVELMSLLKMLCNNLEKADIEVILKSFKSFMTKALSYRSVHHYEVDCDTIEKIEVSFGEAFSAFIPKLTEATFRPIFYKLLDWSIQIEKLKILNSENNCHYLPDQCYFRMIAFYRFCALLADRLKSLFCVFVAPSIGANCSELLQAYHSANFDDQLNNGDGEELMATDNNSKQQQQCKLKLKNASIGEPLIAAILVTLSKCFLYDLNGTFVNKDSTSLIVKPIVNQISNLLGTDADFDVRLNLILQCTQYLIQNNKDETLIKEFNYQILLKTRESSEKIRIGAIKVLHRLILTCSEDYLPFIPEAIPFIAELSEDESEEVEVLVKKLIIDIEQLVGEPINKYL